MMANIALIFSGQYVKYVSSLRAGLPAGTDHWGYSLKLLMGAVLAGGGIVLGLMAYMQNYVCTLPILFALLSFLSSSSCIFFCLLLFFVYWIVLWILSQTN